MLLQGTFGRILHRPASFRTFENLFSCCYNKALFGEFCIDQHRYIWDYWSAIGRWPPIHHIGRWRGTTASSWSLEWNPINWTPLAVVISVFMLLQCTFWRILHRPASVLLRLLIHHWTVTTYSPHRTMEGDHSKYLKLGMESIGLL